MNKIYYWRSGILGLLFMLFAFTLNAVAGLKITASTNKSEVYVHAQIILTLEIKTELNLQNGTLSKLEIPHAIIEPLIEDEQKEIIEDGVKKVVFIRSYALFPSKPGSFTIPAIVFECTVSEPGRGGGFNSFFGRGRRLRVSSDVINIQVKDVPASYPKNEPFLPVENLSIIESFDEEVKEIAVNKALTRRFEIRALGTLSSFLPTMKAPSPKNVEVYSENGTKSQKTSAEGILASSEFSQVYLPTAPGLVSIAEQKIYYWDTEQDALKSAEIRPFEFKVRGDEAAANATPTSQPDAEKSIDADQKAHKESAEIAEYDKASSLIFWTFVASILALLFFILWIITLFILLSKRKKIAAQKKHSADHDNYILLRSQVLKACEEKSGLEALSAVRSLYVYLKSHQENILSSELYTYIVLLEDTLYGHKKISLEDTLIKIKDLVRPSLVELKDPLPALYPE